jgi:hypothetical protein
MQSQGFGQSFFRNPTLIAMVVSVGLHGVFALFTLLLPANSRTPENMRLVGIIPTAPQSTIPDTNDPNATLPVPNAPPLGFGDSPFGTTGLERFLQNPSSLDAQPSRQPAQTAFAPSRGGGGLNIPIKDVPYRAPGRQIPTLKGGSASSGRLGPLPTPQRQSRGSSPYDRSQWGSGLPSLQQGEPSGGSGSLLDPGQFGSGNESFGRQPPISQAKKNLSDFYETQRQTGASISGVQSGGTLTAPFPAAACSAALPGGITTIPIAARFGTNGRYVGHLSVLEGSGVPALDDAAIAQVTSQRVTPASIEQIFSFQVQIPYSEAVCPKPAPANPVPATPGTTPITQPGAPASPSTLTAPTPSGPATPDPKASPSPSAPTGPKPDNGLRDDAPLPGAASTPAPALTPAASPSPAAPPPAPAPTVEPSPAPAPVAPPPSPAPAPPAPEPAPPVEPLPSPEITPPPAAPEPAAPAPAEPAPAPASPPPASP